MNSAQDLIGRSLAGQFVITDILGEGAMGIVYRGFDESSLAEVAIKVLQPSLAVHPEMVARFYREASAARRVDCESTVRILGRGEEGGLYYLVMELLRGKSLAEVLGSVGRLSDQRAARLLIQVCGALAVAHERGVVHRDIKPDNIMVVTDVESLGERVKLLDFGVAKPMPKRAGAIEDSFSTGEVTRYGALVGTPEYMSPEQCTGCEIDQRADIYACGVVLYRMVTGRVPFDGTNLHVLELCQRHLGEEPTAPRQVAPWVRPEMEAVILKALQKSPSARHQSANELREDLERVLAAMEEADSEATQRMSHTDLEKEAGAPLFTLRSRVISTPEPVAPPVESEKEEPAILKPAAPAFPADPESSPLARAVKTNVAPLPGLDSEPAPVIHFIGRPAALPALSEVEQEQSALLATRRARRAKLRRGESYAATVALAAVIGAGVGSLVLALMPFLHH